MLPLPRLKIEFGSHNGFVVLITEQPSLGAGDDRFHLLEKLDSLASVLVAAGILNSG